MGLFSVEDMEKSFCLNLVRLLKNNHENGQWDGHRTPDFRHQTFLYS